MIKETGFMKQGDGKIMSVMQTQAEEKQAQEQLQRLLEEKEVNSFSESQDDNLSDLN